MATLASRETGTIIPDLQVESRPRTVLCLGHLETPVTDSQFFNPIPTSSPYDPSGSLTKFQFVYPLHDH